jgi:hypothetical protein
LPAAPALAVSATAGLLIYLLVLLLVDRAVLKELVAQAGGVWSPISRLEDSARRDLR